MLKSLVQGGRYNVKSRKTELLDPPLNFHNMLFSRIRDDIVKWATGVNSFVVVAMLEAQGFEERDSLLEILEKNRKTLDAANDGSNKGAGILLDMLS
jgi:pumilio family protein 6